MIRRERLINLPIAAGPRDPSVVPAHRGPARWVEHEVRCSAGAGGRLHHVDRLHKELVRLGLGLRLILGLHGVRDVDAEDSPVDSKENLTISIASGPGEEATTRLFYDPYPTERPEPSSRKSAEDRRLVEVSGNLDASDGAEVVVGDGLIESAVRK